MKQAENKNQNRTASQLMRLLGTREIKFRAFVKPLFEIHNVDEIDWFNDTVALDDGDIYSLSDVTLMQFIGLKDSKGNEVYEGDIIRTFEAYEDGDIWDERFHTVIWGGEDYPAFTLKPGLETDENVFSYLILAADYDEKFEVVGNIFANPELLECT